MSACRAALHVGDTYYGCDLQAPHTGVAHFNREAGAHWCSHMEAKAAIKRQKQTVTTGRPL